MTFLARCFSCTLATRVSALAGSIFANITLNSALCLIAVVAASNGQQLQAEVIGDSVIQRAEFDGGTGQLFVYAGLFSNPGDLVASWSFWSDSTASNNCSTGQASYVCYPGSTITPVILTKTGIGSFVVTGIGTTRSNALIGLQTFNFDVVSGSDQVGALSTFGFRSGGPTDTGDFDFGVVNFNNSASLGYYSIGERTVVSIGNSYSGSGPSRAYSIEFTTTAVPEPNEIAVVGIALFMALFAGRIKLSQSWTNPGKL